MQDPDINFILEKVKPYTLCTEARLKNLIRLATYLQDGGIPGDFVECGTARGGSAALLSRYLGQNRHLWLYDSFAGMPPTTEKDGEDAKQWIGKCVGTVADIHEVMDCVGTNPTDYIIRKGWFEETFQQELPQQVALLHCDADWYDSVTLVLETFYPLIPVGGCVILDDFGYWEGCREAFYDFCARHQEKPLLERIEQDQAYWIKGRTNNRELLPQLYPGIMGTYNQPVATNQISILSPHSNSSTNYYQANEDQKNDKNYDGNYDAIAQELAQTRQEIAEMQSSPFWQMHNLWQDFKSSLGL